MKTAEEVTIPALAWILAQAPNQDEVAEAIREGGGIAELDGPTRRKAQ